MAAGDAVYKGDGSQMHKQPDEIEYTVEDGRAYTKKYIGQPSLVDAMVDTQVAAGATKINISMAHPAVLTAYIPYVGAEGKWELIPEQFEKRIEAHPLWSGTEANVKWIEAINKAITAGTSGDDDWDATKPAGTTGSSFNAFRNLKLGGTDSYLSYTYRIRCTKSYNVTEYPQGIQFQFEGSVVTYADIGVPLATKWLQPATFVLVAGGSPAFSPINQWYVFAPSIQKVGNVYQITREWLGADHWSSTLYYGGDGAF
jgi:hypothetical protein